MLILKLGRARARKAYYVMLVNENNRAVYTDMLLQFHSIEQQLYNEASNFEKNDSIIDSICNQLIPPYSPFGPKGPQITMLSSIALVNRCVICVTTVELIYSIRNLYWPLVSPKIDCYAGSWRFPKKSHLLPNVDSNFCPATCIMHDRCGTLKNPIE